MKLEFQSSKKSRVFAQQQSYVRCDYVARKIPHRFQTQTRRWVAQKIVNEREIVHLETIETRLALYTTSINGIYHSIYTIHATAK